MMRQVAYGGRYGEANADGCGCHDGLKCRVEYLAFALFIMQALHYVGRLFL